MTRRLAVDDDVKRWAVSTLAGSVPAVAVHAWFILGPSRSMLGRVTNGHFYEVQARSLIAGRWDVPPNSIGAERFRVGDRFYEYFGPFPAVLRMPVVAVTDRFDGRLSRIAVLVATAVFLTGVSLVAWHVRGIMAGGTGQQTIVRRDQVAVASFLFLCACATPMLFLSSWTGVYHEAIAWGAAWSTVSFGFLLGHLRNAGVRPLLASGTAAILAMLSRASVGVGPVVAISIVAGRWLVARHEHRSTAHTRVAAVALAAAVAPLLLNGYVTWSKFGTVTGVPPIEQQDLLLAWPPRIPAMEANDGSLFGPDYAPTIALQYLRPDGFTLDRLFPWFGFSSRPDVVGGAVFEAFNPSASLTSTSPIFSMFAVSALAVVIRRRTRELAPVIIGAGAGCVGIFSLAFIDHRYLGDGVPLLVVLGAPGWWAMTRWSSGAGGIRAAVRVFVVVVAAWSCWANAALALRYQYAWSMDATTASRAAFLRTQLTLHELVSDAPPAEVRRTTTGEHPRSTALAISGACAALHWWDGREWHPIETTAATGRAEVDLADVPPVIGGPVELVRADGADGRSSLWLLGNRRVEYRWQPTDPRAPTVSIVSQRPLSGSHFELHLDQEGIFSSRVSVSDSRGSLIDRDATLAARQIVAVQRGIAIRSPRTPLCDRVDRLDVARR